MAVRADDVDLGRDRDLVQRFQNGDPAAFDDLYRRYFGRLHRYCQRHTADAHEAEEVAQEAFVKALGSMDRLQGERRFYPWMTVIARRISIDRHRKQCRIELSDEVEEEPLDDDFDHVFAAVDTAHLRDAMARLGPRHRDVLLLREAHAMSYADIAEHLQVPVTTVEALLHRARKALRREFKLVSGETGGLLGLPIFATLGSRLARLRERVADQWGELAIAGAPVAAGAVAAAIFLTPAAPSPDHSQPDRPLAAPVVASAEPDGIETPALPPLGLTEDAVAAPAPAPQAPTEPAATAGPIDVFVGPDGADRARSEAEQMPVSGDLGLGSGGADPERIIDDTADAVDGLVGLLSDPTVPEGTP